MMKRLNFKFFLDEFSDQGYYKTKVLLSHSLKIIIYKYLV